MRKTILRVMYSAIVATIICIGCGGDDGGQARGLDIGGLLDVITGGGMTHYTLTINVTPSAGGSVSRSSSNTSYKAGEQVTVKAMATDGYMFTGWSGASNDTTATVTVIMDGDKNLTANFIPIDAPTYTLTVNLEPSAGGNVSREPNRTVYSVGEKVIITTTVADGYAFTGWSGDANGAEMSVTVTMDKDLTINANFQQQTYSLSLGANPTSGGTVSRDPQKAAYTYGERVTVTATPANGYNFKGWENNAAPNNSIVTVIMDGNKMLTAIFEQQIYKLTTNVSPSDYGSILRNPNKETYTYGEQVTVTATPADHDGDNYYAFDGWTGAIESKSAGVTITMDDNKTLTAKFTRGSVPYYTLTTITNPDVGTAISRNPNNASYRENQTVTVTAPTVNGYTFTGWSGASTSTNSIVTITMDDNKTLTANYSQLDYTLTINVSPESGGQVSRTPYKDKYKHNDQVTVSAEEKPGYKFTGWSGTSTSTSPNIVIMMDGNKELTAHFESRTYTLDVSKNIDNGGDVSRSPNKDVYNYNEQVTVTATAKNCYTFTRWSGASTSTSESVIITMNDDKKLTSNFQLSQYSLTTEVSPSGGGTVSRSPNQTTYTCGSTVTLTATAASGYVFKEWSGDASGTANQMPITMDGNKKVTANFTPLYTLTANVSSSGGGIVERSPDQTNYTQGTIVIVTAKPTNNCYEFTGWSGVATGTTNPLLITMDGNKTLTANFQQKQYTLVINTNEGSATRYPNKETYVCGEQVTVTATPNTGKSFLGWSGAAAGMTNPLIITMDDNKVLTANFNPDKYMLTTIELPPSVGGSISRDLDKDYYDYGDIVTVTATPINNGTVMFDSWSGAPSGAVTLGNKITFTVNSNVVITAKFKVKKAKIIQFPTITSYPYTFNDGFPATVEVYAFGAGGGASGGSRNAGTGDGGKEKDTITGGGGGGGAAVYAKFGIANATNDINKIYVTVGKGGDGGARKSSSSGDGWNYGFPGTAGTASTVKIGNISSPELEMVAGGGGYGLGGRGGNIPENQKDPDRGFGGTGGIGTVKPRVSSFLDTSSVKSGNRGQDGAYCNDCKVTIDNGYGGGGSGGILPVNAIVDNVYKGNVSAGKGGNGMPDKAGTSGEPGQVIIKFTWWE